MSSTPLTEVWRALPARGHNFVVVSKNPPKGEYIAAKKEVCQHLPQKTAVGLRDDTIKLLNKAHPQTKHHPPGIQALQGTKIRSVQDHPHYR